MCVANYLEISLSDPQTHGEGRARFTDWRLEMRTNVPVFKVKESAVRRRYSDFKVGLATAAGLGSVYCAVAAGRGGPHCADRHAGPAGQGLHQTGAAGQHSENTAMFWQVPFITNDDGIFEAEFIEDRRRGLEVDNSL